jgi:hypothetical protein
LAVGEPEVNCRKRRAIGKRTVDGDGNALGEDVAVGTLEGGDLAELVELEVLGVDTLGRLGVNNVKVEVVGLCDGQQGGGTGVALRGSVSCAIENDSSL